MTGFWSPGEGRWFGNEAGEGWGISVLRRMMKRSIVEGALDRDVRLATRPPPTEPRLQRPGEGAARASENPRSPKANEGRAEGMLR
jgi:hypothetical protein